MAAREVIFVKFNEGEEPNILSLWSATKSAKAFLGFLLSSGLDGSVCWDPLRICFILSYRSILFLRSSISWALISVN